MSIVDSGGNGMMKREHFDIYGARERARQAMRERMQAPRHGMVERERIIVRAAAPERTRFAFFGEDIVALRGLQLENALNRLHHVNQSEIAMAKMAETKATNPQVLNYAHRVRNEHQLLDLKTRALAARRGITLANYQPATYEKALARRLNQIKRGPMFEAAFLRVMNRGNDQMVEELTMVRDDLPDSSAARPLYDQALPIVTAHRDAVPSVQDRIRARLEEGDIGE
jgi:predicted outer membrane protein